MTFLQLQLLFNRALSHTFTRKKLGFVSLMLGLCGVLVIFCRGLALESGSWLGMSLTFLPIFLCTAVLSSMGVVLIRLYHDEIAGRTASINKIIAKSWPLLLNTSYLSLPLLLAYWGLWMLLGIFFLLREIPYFGAMISSIFSFAPFLLILGCLLLSIATLLLLFFTTPALALGSTRSKVMPLIRHRLRDNLFVNFILLIVGIIPVCFAVGLLVLSAYLTDLTLLSDQKNLYIILHWFFMMLPFAVLLSPPIVFLFNFAAEAHVWILKRGKREE